MESLKERKAPSKRKETKTKGSDKRKWKTNQMTRKKGDRRQN
jgi:hypothetical protein